MSLRSEISCAIFLLPRVIIRRDSTKQYAEVSWNFNFVFSWLNFCQKGIEWVLYEKCSSFVKKMLGNGFKTDSGGQQVKLQPDRARNFKIRDASFR